MENERWPINCYQIIFTPQLPIQLIVVVRNTTLIPRVVAAAAYFVLARLGLEPETMELSQKLGS